MGQAEIKREAVARQGAVIRCRNRSFRIDGDQNRAAFQSGGEGLVHRAVDGNNQPCRIKCFWEPTALRRKRSEMLVRQGLADLGKSVADALGGAPYEMLDSLGPHTPFALVMKDIRGSSWKDLKEQALQRSRSERYPPAGWPSLSVRATWAYGLATAVHKMEERNFIHADLSDGNVMVTPSGANAGDMALVDFDAFVHPGHPHLDTTCKGSDGFAAPEIWNSKSVSLGSDRIGMAVLIQEFLRVGDPRLSIDDSFGWRYDQPEIASRRGKAHDPFQKLYPELAEFVTASLRATKPELRPTPQQWRPHLRALATGGVVAARPGLANVLVCPHPIAKAKPLPFGDAQKTLDLAGSQFRIRATLARNKDGSIDVVIRDNALVNVQDPKARTWKPYTGPSRVPVSLGMVLFDPTGDLNARIDGSEVTKATVIKSP